MSFWLMSSQCQFLLFALVLIQCSSDRPPEAESSSKPNRVKRVVNGSPITDRYAPYSALRYFVWMGDGHSCNHKDPTRYTIDCFPRPKNERCGAALLTTTILQTTCDCLVVWKKQPVDHLTLPTIMHSWEDKLDIFIGYNAVSRFRFGMLSKKFYIHERCARVEGEPNWLITHDFGLVTLRTQTDQGDLKEMVQTYAPIYPVEDLQKIFAYSMNTKSVCLTLGFGSFRLSHGRINPDKSEELRHGWVTNQNYEECKQLTTKTIPVADGAFDYASHATWACGIQLPAHGEYTAMGDEGGPLSCNNYYFGILGRRIAIPGGPDATKVLQVSAAIAFNPFENALEYREDFERVIQQPNEPTFRPGMVSVVPHSSSPVFAQISATLCVCMCCVSFFLSLL